MLSCHLNCRNQFPKRQGSHAEATAMIRAPSAPATDLERRKLAIVL